MCHSTCVLPCVSGMKSCCRHFDSPPHILVMHSLLPSLKIISVGYVLRLHSPRYITLQKFTHITSSKLQSLRRIVQSKIWSPSSLSRVQYEWNYSATIEFSFRVLNIKNAYSNEFNWEVWKINTISDRCVSSVETTYSSSSAVATALQSARNPQISTVHTLPPTVTFHGISETCIPDIAKMPFPNQWWRLMCALETAFFKYTRELHAEKTCAHNSSRDSIACTGMWHSAFQGQDAVLLCCWYTFRSAATRSCPLSGLKSCCSHHRRARTPPSKTFDKPAMPKFITHVEWWLDLRKPWRHVSHINSTVWYHIIPSADEQRLIGFAPCKRSRLWQYSDKL